MLDRSKREAFASLSSFLGSSKKEPKALHVRPPYLQGWHMMQAHCPSCIETPCVSACEEAIIELDEEHIPFLLFTKSGCTFCEECARVCPHEVLHVIPENDATINAQFSINTAQCIAWDKVICRSCLDVCDAKAITFFSLLRPLIEKDKCTGCGFCYGICPTQAIAFKPVRDKEIR